MTGGALGGGSGAGKAGMRIPAREIEAAVGQAIAEALSNPLALLDKARIAIEPDGLPQQSSGQSNLALTFAAGTTALSAGSPPGFGFSLAKSGSNSLPGPGRSAATGGSATL